MNKIYIPISKGKTKSAVRGYWRDKKTGIVYYDYIRVIPKQNIHKDYIRRVQKKHSQISIFYIIDNIGYVYTDKKNCLVLCNKIRFTIPKKFDGLKSTIKKLLIVHEGLTVYIEKNNYIIEVFTP